jgi:hypothetical protein
MKKGTKGEGGGSVSTDKKCEYIAHLLDMF